MNKKFIIGFLLIKNIMYGFFGPGPLQAIREKYNNGKRYLRRGLNSCAQAEFFQAFENAENAIDKEISFLKKDPHNIEIQKIIIEYMFWVYKVAKYTPNEGQEIMFKAYLDKKIKKISKLY